MRIILLMFVTVLLSTSGCADVIAVHKPTSAPPVQYTGNDVDPPKEWPVAINSIWLEAKFHEDGSSPINSRMNYNAYHATMKGSATVTDDVGSATYDFGTHEKHQFWDFLNVYWWEQVMVSTPRSCGTSINTSWDYRVWWRGVGLGDFIVLDEVRTNRNTVATQSVCPTEDQHVPAGGGGGANPSMEDNVPVSWCVVRIRYDIITGEILNTTLLYCY